MIFEYKQTLWGPHDPTSLAELQALGREGWQVVHVRADRDRSHEHVLLMRKVERL